MFARDWIRSSGNYSILDGIVSPLKENYKRNIREKNNEITNQEHVSIPTLNNIIIASHFSYSLRYLEQSWLCKHIASPISVHTYERMEKLSTFVGENISVAIISGNSPG